jgi:iron complex transport system substrate-binding protein
MIRRALLALPLAALAAPPIARGASPRLVVAGGGLAEIVVALGAREAIVGADSTSLFPTALRALPQIGYLRNLSAEGVLSLRPELLLLSHEAGPPTAVAQLRAAGVRVAQAGRVQSPAELSAAIHLVAEALDRPREGAALAAAVAEDFAALAAALPRPPRPPRALFLLAAGGGGAPMASGTGTTAAAMLGLAGAVSAITSYEGYRPVTAEAALAAAPDWLVAPSHSVEARGGVERFLAQPQLSLLPAARAGRLASFDSLYLLGFGPRAPHAARDLAALLHGRAEMARLPERPWLRDAA